MQMCTLSTFVHMVNLRERQRLYVCLCTRVAREVHFVHCRLQSLIRRGRRDGPHKEVEVHIVPRY